MRQLETVFRAFSGHVAVTGVLASTHGAGEPIDILVAADLLSKVAWYDEAPLQLADPDLKAELRTYLKANLETVLQQDDFDGEEKANLASAIAQLGYAEDIPDLVRLIRADIVACGGAQSQDGRKPNLSRPRRGCRVGDHPGW